MDMFAQVINLSEREKSALEELRIKIKNSDEQFLKETGILDDNLLMMYLRCRKLKVESAYNKFLGFQRHRINKYPNIFNVDNSRSVFETLSGVKVDILNATDHRGGLVLYLKLASYNPTVITNEEIIRQIIFCGIHLNWRLNVQKCGVSLIVDCGDLSWAIAKSHSPSMAYKIMDILISGLPWRINNIHHINSSFIHRTVYSIFKMLCPAKLAERLHIHCKVEDLLEWFPASSMPRFLGGTADDNVAIDYEAKKSMLDMHPKMVQYYDQYISSKYNQKS